MPWQLHIYPVFPRCARDPLAARMPNQPANKLCKRWVIGRYVLPCGAGCCLWTRGVSGRRARPWGRAAPWAARRQAVRATSFDRRFGSLSGQALPPTRTAARSSDLAGATARPHGSSSTLHADGGGGFALHEALWRRIVGVSDPHVVQFPPFGDGQATA